MSNKIICAVIFLVIFVVSIALTETQPSTVSAITSEELTSGTLTIREGTAYMDMLGEVAETCSTYVLARDGEHTQICMDIIGAFRDKMTELVAEHPQIDDLPGVRMP